MRKLMWFRVSGVIILGCILAGGQTKSSLDVYEVLRWFSADTNAFAVANGPFPLTDLHELRRLLQNDEGPPKVFSDEQLKGIFEMQALTPWAIYRTQMPRLLVGENVLLAVEGYRPRSGKRPMEQCAVVVFERESVQDKLLNPLAGPLFTTWNIDGHGFMALVDRSDDGTPQLIVAQPRPNVMIISDSPDYLRLVLARALGEQGERALPDTLPEWSYVDTHATFWALGHDSYSDSEPESSASSGDESDADRKDIWRTLIGGTLSFNPASRTGKLILVFTDPHAFQYLERLHSVESVQDPDEENTTSREIDPGVVQGTTFLANRSTAANLVVYGMWLLIEPQPM